MGAGLLVYFVKNTDLSTFSLVSPLPHIFKSGGKRVLASEYWKPSIARVGGDSTITMSAQAVISYDLTSNRMLYGKNTKKRLPIASLTKIMTAYVALETEDINKTFRVDDNSATVGENSMGLASGEELNLEDLLYGLILPSGNDAAETIARGSAMGRDNFIYLMNKKTEDLGLSDTRFSNPSGLEGDGVQYSTVYDLLVITRFALLNPIFAKAVSTYEYEIEATNHNKQYFLYNDTNLLTTYPGVKGVKTGFTNEAGMCLVTYIEYKGHRIISVILNSENRRQEMKDLLDYSLQSLDIVPPSHP